MNKTLMRYSAFLIILVFGLFSCSGEKDIDISDIKVDSELIRFDSLFYHGDEKTLRDLKGEFPKMFPVEYSDSSWLAKMNDSIEIAIYDKSVKVFNGFDNEYSEIVDVFKHFKYYFPQFNGADVYTIISDFDYQYPVLFTGDRLFVSLDMYLGANEEEYGIFPVYLAKNMRPERIKVDVANALSTTVSARDPFDKTLIAEMIYKGKLLYLKQKMLPLSDDSLLIGYTHEEIKWCEDNEFEVWAYIVKNKYLYNSNAQLKKRFIELAPFTKFFLELDRQSPGRVGEWLGWQIVKSYMDNNDISVEELAKNKDFKEIFRKSKYKPRK